MLETRPGLLRNVAMASKILGIVLLVIGVIGLLAGLTAGGNMPAIVSMFAKLGGLLILITGVFFFIILYAVGDMVLVLLGIEESTRGLREQVARVAASAQTAPRSGGNPGPASAVAPQKPASTAAPAEPKQETSQEAAATQDPEDVIRRATEQARKAAEIAQRNKSQKS